MISFAVRADPENKAYMLKRNTGIIRCVLLRSINEFLASLDYFLLWIVRVFVWEPSSSTSF